MGATMNRLKAFKTAREVYDRLNGEAQGKFPEATWDQLVERGFVNNLMTNKLDWDNFLSFAKILAEQAGHGAKEQRSGAKCDKTSARNLDDRLRAESELTSKQANQDESVQLFRKEELGNVLLKPKDVEAWVKTQAENDGAPGCAMQFFVSDEVADAADKDFSEQRPLTLGVISNRNRTRRYLDFPVGNSGASRRVETACEGILERLRVIAQRLTTTFGWRPSEASGFILTDQAPTIRAINCTVTSKSWKPASKIVLEAHFSCPPALILACFQHAIKQHSKVRAKPLSTKQAALVQFIATEHGEKTWNKKLAAWNERHPEWSYDHESHFRRDARAGYGRILGKSYATPPPNQSDFEKLELYVPPTQTSSSIDLQIRMAAPITSSNFD